MKKERIFKITEIRHRSGIVDFRINDAKKASKNSVTENQLIDFLEREKKFSS